MGPASCGQPEARPHRLRNLTHEYALPAPFRMLSKRPDRPTSTVMLYDNARNLAVGLWGTRN